MSDKLFNKLKNKNSIQFVCIGTSISAGAHTFSQYFKNSQDDIYCNRLAKGLKNLYGSNIKIKNLSLTGSSINIFNENFNNIIENNPELVIIEFGMNDHVWMPDVDAFIKKLELIITNINSAKIDCIVVGFFQQNPEWEMENINKTIEFNNAMKNLCSSMNVFYVDIYKLFSSISNKNIYKDLMGDYMHHPSTFGHTMYYKEIMPYFLTNSIKSNKLFNLLTN